MSSFVRLVRFYLQQCSRLLTELVVAMKTESLRINGITGLEP